MRVRELWGKIVDNLQTPPECGYVSAITGEMTWIAHGDRSDSSCKRTKADRVSGVAIGDSRLRRIVSTSWRDLSEARAHENTPSISPNHICVPVFCAGPKHARCQPAARCVLSWIHDRGRLQCAFSAHQRRWKHGSWLVCALFSRCFQLQHRCRRRNAGS